LIRGLIFCGHPVLHNAKTSNALHRKAHTRWKNTAPAEHL